MKGSPLNSIYQMQNPKGFGNAVIILDCLDRDSPGESTGSVDGSIVWRSR